MFKYKKNIFFYNSYNKNLLKFSYLLNLRFYSKLNIKKVLKNSSNKKNINKNITKNKILNIKKIYFNKNLLKLIKKDLEIFENKNINSISNKTFNLDRIHPFLINTISLNLNIIFKRFLKKQKLSKIIQNILQKNILKDKKIKFLKSLILIIIKINYKSLRFLRLKKNKIKEGKVFIRNNILYNIKFLLRLKQKFKINKSYNSEIYILNRLLKENVIKYKLFLYEKKNNNSLKVKNHIFNLKKSISQKITFKFNNNNLIKFLDLNKKKFKETSKEFLKNIKKTFFKKSLNNKFKKNIFKLNYYSSKYFYYIFLYKYLILKIKNTFNIKKDLNKYLYKYLFKIVKLKKKIIGRRFIKKFVGKKYNKNTLLKGKLFLNKKLKKILKNLSLKSLNKKLRFLLFKLFFRKNFKFNSIFNIIML